MRVVRILVWHGWLLEGSGSNVATARIVEVWRAQGHDVLLLCQERHPERYRWIDATGTVDVRRGISALTSNPDASTSSGRCVLLRPEIGPLLPVFVVDHYEGFDDVRSFVDVSERELEDYLRANVEALRMAAEIHRPDVAVVGHGIPGAAIGRRALGPGTYVAKIHGSDLEYAIRPDARYRSLAREGLEAARAIVGPSIDVLGRCTDLVPVATPVRVVPPGVDVAAFRPRVRSEALYEVAARLDDDAARTRGRPTAFDADVERALDARDGGAIDALFERYDEDAPEPEAADRLRRLAEREGPVVGYLGKLIPQKGVELFLEALPGLRHDAAALVVGFGSDRDWLAALLVALRRGDRDAVAWLRDTGGLPVDPVTIPHAPWQGPDVTFTGLLDHRYAPGALAAMDVQVVPSILEEAFGMVAAEGAAAGALPLVARHSGLAEVAAALETDVGRPRLFSFEPGAGAVRRLAEGIDELLSLPVSERDELRRAVSSFVGNHWTWERTAAKLLAAAGVEA